MRLAPTAETVALLHRAERHRALQLGTGVLGACLVGTIYAFGIYAHHLKERFHLTQQQLTTVSTAGFVIANFNFPAGLLYDALGAPAVNVVGGTVMGVGFTLLGLAFDGKIVPRLDGPGNHSGTGGGPSNAHDGSPSFAPASTVAVLSIVYAVVCWPATSTSGCSGWSAWPASAAVPW